MMQKEKTPVMAGTIPTKDNMSNSATSKGKPVIFVFILFLAVAMIYSSSSNSAVFAVKPHPRYWSGECIGQLTTTQQQKCCWSEDTGVDSVVGRYCQTCKLGEGGNVECEEVVQQEMVGGGIDIVPPVEEGVASPPPPGPGGPGNVLPEGVIEERETSPIPEGPAELTPQVDCTQNPEDPFCETATIPEGEQEAEEPTTEDEQPSEEPDPEEDNGNN